MQEGTVSSHGHLTETVASRAELWAETWRGDARAAACPTRLLLDRIADKWTVLILVTLEAGPLRFNALRRHVEGVSQKMLSQTLKQMERDGLISRTVEATVPVSVTYGLTPLGLSLYAVMQPLMDWAETHMPMVAQAQGLYDGSRSG